MPLSRRAALAAPLALAAPAVHAQAQGASWPDRPIRIIVPLAPGGGTDIFARLLAELAAPALGQPIVVENRTGAVGTVGMQAVAESRPDGLTLGFTVNSPITSAHLAVPVRYNAAEAFEPMFIAAAAPFALCVRPNWPQQDIRALIEAARARPETITYGSDGVASTMHLAAERVFRRLGVRLTMVPFQGAAQTLTAFSGGHLDLYGGSVAPITPTARAGGANCLLVTSNTPHPDLPNAATLASLGLPEEETLIWFAMMAPRGIPAERRTRLLEAFRAAHASDRFQERARAQGTDPTWRGPEEFGRIIARETTAFAQVAQTLGIERPR